jgi:hypothetical protein
MMKMCGETHSCLQQKLSLQWPTMSVQSLLNFADLRAVQSHVSPHNLATDVMFVEIINDNNCFVIFTSHCMQRRINESTHKFAQNFLFGYYLLIHFTMTKNSYAY